MNRPVSGLQIPGALLLAPHFLALRPRVLWTTLTRQPFSTWAVITYLFFEYVRPQTIYPAIDFLPWAQLSLIACVVSMLVESAKLRRWTNVDSAMVAYTVLFFASIVGAQYPDWSMRYIDVYLSWILVYAVISTNINTQSRLVLMLLTWFLWNLKMTLHAFRSWASIGFEFRSWGVTGAPGWFQNSGEFGIQTTVILPISLYFALGVRPYVSKPVFLALLVLPATALSGAIASSSRGALLAMAVLGLWMLARSRYKLRGFFTLAVVGVLVWTVLPEEQKARFTAAGEDETSTSRLTYWTRGIQLANENPILGIGYRNWIPVYTQRYAATLAENRRVELPHNFVIEAWTELGYPGLIALLALLGTGFALNAHSRRIAKRLGDHGRLAHHLAVGFDGALLGYMVSGSFVTVLYYPYLWVNLSMIVALHLSVARTARAVQGAQRRSASYQAPVPPPLAGAHAHRMT